MSDKLYLHEREFAAKRDIASELYRDLVRLRTRANDYIEACPARSTKATVAMIELYAAIDTAEVTLAKAKVSA